ncbi:MAG: dTDP-4-amino-4,6-dideoxygalactose transaminase [Chitinispirillales bacterium]|jgi:dTDP-4-amino-4,6-dideoxygalactose transaminase|nr:dTDP-4-amino-4,6-dideoxygalactose transaminase [Chitinispirillales bacterium]
MQTARLFSENPVTIPFNKPYNLETSLKYVAQAAVSGHLSGNGAFTAKCQKLLRDAYGFRAVMLTTSCTDALEMCAMLADIKPGDEVIAPSYTFVTSALAFVRQGASVVFADSRADHPGIDEDAVERLVTERTKAIVLVHYAGVACDMDRIMRVAGKHGLIVVEDAAMAVDSTYKGKPLGGIGHLGTFSFHETKNIHSGEGGALVVNDERFARRAEIIWEKGTNRAEFFRGEVNKYNWVDTGSSFLPSELTAAYLYGQLEQVKAIQKRRVDIWKRYYEALSPYQDRGAVRLPHIPKYASNNASMFYMVFDSIDKRSFFIRTMKEKGCAPVFHYLSLHTSPFYKDKHDGRTLVNADRYSDCLVRLPLYYELWGEELDFTIGCVKDTLDMM